MPQVPPFSSCMRPPTWNSLRLAWPPKSSWLSRIKTVAPFGTAAHFFRAAVPKGATVLILDNHDDFGGHAKRNEFHVGGRMQLLNGGTWGIQSPTPYRPPAAGLLASLGINPVAMSKTC